MFGKYKRLYEQQKAITNIMHKVNLSLLQDLDNEKQFRKDILSYINKEYYWTQNANDQGVRLIVDYDKLVAYINGESEKSSD